MDQKEVLSVRFTDIIQQVFDHYLKEAVMQIYQYLYNIKDFKIDLKFEYMDILCY